MRASTFLFYATIISKTVHSKINKTAQNELWGVNERKKKQLQILDILYNKLNQQTVIKYDLIYHFT